jgi:hypothetical protein
MYNAAGQCSYCNRWQHGEQYEFSRAIVSKHGVKILGELMALKHNTVKFTRDHLQAMLELFSKPPPTGPAPGMLGRSSNGEAI